MARRDGRGAPVIYKERLKACRRELKKLRAGAFLLVNPPDFFYLTGFSGDESAAMVTARGVHLISDRRFEEQIKKECPWTATYMRRGSLNAEIATACKDLKVTKLAVQSDHLTLANQAELRKLAKGVRLVEAPPICARLRTLKSADEVRAMNKALRVAEDAFNAMRKTIRAGQTELEMAARLEYEMKRRGASGPAFPTICAEGANAALPHAHPGKRKAKSGSAMLFDWGARVGGYCSDLTRMLFLGKVPARFKEIYAIVLDAQMAAIAAIRPGRRMCDIDAVARRHIEKAGYGNEFSHGLGHGLGLDVHEAPSLSWRSQEKLRPGMLVTVEPGIYLPGVGGVRIEDDVLVMDRGCRILSRLSKRLADSVV
jgi:Xaa-Pro aminopeptidase